MNRAKTNEAEYSKRCEEAVSLARAIFSDEGDYLRNVSELSSLRFILVDDEFDQDFKVFIAISSDTDYMPIGVARNRCSTSWLNRCDAELVEIKESYRRDVEKSCKSIIERFSENA